MRYLFPLLIIFGCSQFIKMTDGEYFEEIKQRGEGASIVYSHNINGETHPCGCRNFPLGGLPQAYGQIQALRQKQTTVYVDTGDTLFDSPVIAEFTKQSAEFKAVKIAEALDLLGLKFMTPGDQDFALGTAFLDHLAKKHQFKFLISNGIKKFPIKSVKKSVLEMGGQTVHFFGIVDPAVMRPQYRKLFEDPWRWLEKNSASLKKRKGDLFVLLSHSGIEVDRAIAKKYPVFDWIIGAHSQSFLTSPVEIGETRLTQVLSRNHYLGQINLAEKKSEQFSLLEIRDDRKDLVTNNPLTSWLSDFKQKYDEVQAVENSMAFQNDEEVKIATYISCSQCHSKQVDFWQSTTHSIAYASLVHAKASNNNECVKCHSVGLKQPGGFSNKQNIIHASEVTIDHDAYWQELDLANSIKHPIRQLAGEKIKSHAQNWLKYDRQKKIEQNYANVQCLNCHNQDAEHPFNESTPLSSEDIQNKCLACHTRDQSPEWYDKDEKGLATSLNAQYFSQKLKAVSCPKIER